MQVLLRQIDPRLERKERQREGIGRCSLKPLPIITARIGKISLVAKLDCDQSHGTDLNNIRKGDRNTNIELGRREVELEDHGIHEAYDDGAHCTATGALTYYVINQLLRTPR